MFSFLLTHNGVLANFVSKLVFSQVKASFSSPQE